MPMRTIALGMAALLLVGCGSNDVPSPAERKAGAEAPPDVDPDLVAVHGQGLVAGAEAFYFAAGRNEVESALASSLGKATDTTDMAECGAGPMTSTSFEGGLTVNFQDGNLVGWNLMGAPDNIVVDADVQVEMGEDQARAAQGFAMIAESTLGDEFVLTGEEIGGFFEEGQVSMLYAGTQCFFR